MALREFNPKSGIVKDDTSYQSEDIWTDCDKVRFHRGQPQIIGGWHKAINTQVSGTARGLYAWTDWQTKPYVAIGTHTKLYVMQDDHLYNITPTVEKTGTLINPFHAITGSATIRVISSAHSLRVGDTIAFSGVSAFSGITPIGSYVVTTIASADEFSFISEFAATATASAAGGSSVTYKYPRFPLTDPFSTTSGGALVRVSHAGHNRIAGDVVEFDNATAVGGVTVSGYYTVASVSGTDAYYIPTATAASTTAGGGTVHTLYELHPGAQNFGGIGYGGGPYGVGPYGIHVSGGTQNYLRTWALDNFGNDLVATPYGDHVYEWPRNLLGRAISVVGAPLTIAYSFVTPERFLVLLGTYDEAAQFDPLLVRWSDIINKYTWLADAANLAGSYPLGKGSRCVAGCASQNFNFIWTDTSLYAMRYTGGTEVFAFDLVGSNCGLIGPNGFAEKAGLAFWMSPTLQFFLYDGQIKRLECPMQKYINDRISKDQQSKVFACFMSKYNEVWWFYPSASSTNECDSYVVYSLAEDSWFMGSFDRTAMMDNNLVNYPLAVSDDGFIYYHENGYTDDGNAISSYIESGEFTVDSGNKMMFINRVIPDFKQSASNVQITLKMKKYPNGDEVIKGPYTVTPSTEKISLRARGRHCKLRIDCGTDDFWRLGKVRLDMQEDGER